MKILITDAQLEKLWNKGTYDYQFGYCHYFAYNIINILKKKYQTKDISYYMLLAQEIDENGDIDNDILIHVYIKFGEIYLDSNGFNTQQDIDERLEWYETQKKWKQPENWELSVFEEESDKIPDMFFNNRFCNTKKIKEDLTMFLSHPEVAKLFENI